MNIVLIPHATKQNKTKQNIINRKTKKIGGLGWLNPDPFES
jgi:hypothetical protein